MKNLFDENTNGSVLNDYEESIMFDEDDPDFRPNDDSELSCRSSHKRNENGK